MAYDTSEWTELFVASAGASAALAGLVFVAVSINVERILQFPGLPERALETVLLLLAVVLVSLMGLIPGQSATTLGIELLFVGLALAAMIVKQSTKTLPEGSPTTSHLLGRLLLWAGGTVPFVVGGASLIAETGGGLYWVAAGILLGIVGGVANAWVLLVEILR
jgi:modulator of FtsH protease